MDILSARDPERRTRIFSRPKYNSLPENPIFSPYIFCGAVVLSGSRGSTKMYEKNMALSGREEHIWVRHGDRRLIRLNQSVLIGDEIYSIFFCQILSGLSSGIPIYYFVYSWYARG